VDPIAEQADELAGPERREGAVECEADIRVAPDALDDRRDGRKGDSTKARSIFK